MSDESGHCVDGIEQHNPRSVYFKALEYPTLRGRAMRNHNRTYHEFDIPALHVPADSDGVVP